MGGLGSSDCDWSTIWTFTLGRRPPKFFRHFCRYGNWSHSSVSCVPLWKTTPLFRYLSRTTPWYQLPFCSIGLFCYDSCWLCPFHHSRGLSGCKICLVCLSFCRGVFESKTEFSTERSYKSGLRVV